MKLVIFTIMMILFAGCSMQEEIAKSDSFGDSIILERSGMYTLPEFGVQIYTLTQSNLNVRVYHYDGSLTKELNVALHPGTTYSVFEDFERVNFSSLNDRYLSTVNIADVGQGVLSYNNHSVLIMPYVGRGNPSEISDLIDSFDTFLSSVNLSEVFVPTHDVEEVGVVTYSYTGKQCVDDIWEVWYTKDGFSPYEDRLGEIEVISNYYFNKGIKIEDIKIVESDHATCQACEVCSNSYSYEIQVEGYQEILENDGWRTEGREFKTPILESSK
jgi:uncharacterized protein YcfL